MRLCEYQQFTRYCKAVYCAQGPQWKGCATSRKMKKNHWRQLNTQKLNLWGSEWYFRRWETIWRSSHICLPWSYSAATICFQPLMDEWRRLLNLGLKQGSKTYPAKPENIYIYSPATRELSPLKPFFFPPHLQGWRQWMKQNRKNTEKKEQKWQRRETNIRPFGKNSWTGFWKALASLLLKGNYQSWKRQARFKKV